MVNQYGGPNNHVEKTGVEPAHQKAGAVRGRGPQGAGPAHRALPPALRGAAAAREKRRGVPFFCALIEVVLFNTFLFYLIFPLLSSISLHPFMAYLPLLLWLFACLQCSNFETEC